MSERIRRLNAEGTERFSVWLGNARKLWKGPPPTALLADPGSSEIVEPEVFVDREPNGKPFASRYDFGMYLREQLKPFAKTSISRDVGVWNWLSLFYIDQLAPISPDGTRKILDVEVYILAPTFKHDSYYRHAIRTAWLAAQEHGENSRVLLVPAGKPRPGTGILAHRGEIIEQLASRQQLMGSTTIIESAVRLYLDPATDRPKKGAGGSDRGSPRRFATVLAQLDLTYDLNSCSVNQLLKLLPKEFERWKKEETASPS
jgi:hypothetical protein